MNEVMEVPSAHDSGLEDSGEIQVGSGALRELLEGLILHADKSDNLPALNAVLLRAEAGYLIGTATDRHRLGEGKIDVIHGALPLSLVSLKDIKLMSALSKASVSGIVTLTRKGDGTLTLNSGNQAINAVLLSDKFPPSEHLFVAIEEAPIPVEGIAFNPLFFADYAKIAGKNNPVKVYFGGENKPMRIRITSVLVEWRLLLMPMRYKD